MSLQYAGDHQGSPGAHRAGNHTYEVCAPEVGIKGRDKKLHSTVYVGCNYLSMPLIRASDTRDITWESGDKENDMGYTLNKGFTIYHWPVEQT